MNTTTVLPSRQEEIGVEQSNSFTQNNSKSTEDVTTQNTPAPAKLEGVGGVLGAIVGFAAGIVTGPVMVSPFVSRLDPVSILSGSIGMASVGVIGGAIAGYFIEYVMVNKYPEKH